MSNQSQGASKKAQREPAMEEIDNALKGMLEGNVDMKTESATMQAQLTKMLSVFQARETQLVTTAEEIKAKYASILKEATDKANSINAAAQKSAADSAKSASASLVAARKTASDEVKNATEKGQKIVADSLAQAAAILATAKKEREAWEEEKALVADIQKFKPVVKVNVGGTKFTTSRTTLCRFPDTMIGAMYSGRHELVQDDEGFHFIDRDGTHFRYILNFLRAPENFKCELTGAALAELKSECEYYGIKSMMFPFTQIAPFTARNCQNINVTVSQDDEGVFTINDIPVRVCGQCGIGDYAPVSQQPVNYYVPHYHHYIQQFAQAVFGQKGVISDEQPKVVSPCRICQR